jgi:benzoyl-CoA reductase/2-hydroxyglutaryl-CoA dehydratase subunit BcrC/BadD/HgdB
LTGEYDFLDGVVFTNGCDHTRRAYDNWRAQEKTPSFMHMIPVPHVLTEDGLQWYREEVIAFKEHLEESFGVEVTDESLNEAISVYNETRSLLKQLYELRTRKAPPITGAETLKIVVASVSMPRDRYNQMLKELLDEMSLTRNVSGPGCSGTLRRKQAIPWIVSLPVITIISPARACTENTPQGLIL